MKLIQLLTLALLLTLVSCGGSDSKDEPGDNKYDVVGVWGNGNYFVSFASDGTYVAYLGSEFIDGGSFLQDKNILTCNNPYFNRNTVYIIKSIENGDMSVTAKYIDVSGRSYEKLIVFKKSDKAPLLKEETLTGKDIKWVSRMDINMVNITMSFNSYNSGVQTSTASSLAKYPIRFYYIFIGDKVYFQYLENTSGQTPTIGAWPDEYNTVNCFKLTFGSNGDITDFEKVRL